jgi:hypothetical protein
MQEFRTIHFAQSLNELSLSARRARNPSISNRRSRAARQDYSAVPYYVSEQKSAHPPDPAVVRDIYGLTLVEARVASLVGSGIPPRVAAERLGVAEDTAEMC